MIKFTWLFADQISTKPANYRPQPPDGPQWVKCNVTFLPADSNTNGRTCKSLIDLFSKRWEGGCIRMFLVYPECFADCVSLHPVANTGGQVSRGSALWAPSPQSLQKSSRHLTNGRGLTFHGLTRLWKTSTGPLRSRAGLLVNTPRQL